MKKISKIVLLFLLTIFTLDLLAKENKQLYLPISIDFEQFKISKMAISYPAVKQEAIKDNITTNTFFNAYKIIKNALVENNPNIIKKFMLNDKNFNNHSFYANFAADYKYVKDMEKNGTIKTYQVISNKNYCFFIWGVLNKSTSKNLLLITFLNNENGTYILSNIPSYSALLLLDIYRQQNIKPVANDTNFKYHIPLQDSTKYEILTLLFNGEKYNNKNNSSKMKRIVNFYYDLSNVLKMNDGVEKYASFFTQGSKEKIVRGYKANKKQFNAYREYQINNMKEIRFVIYAEPFYIVFYSFKSSPKDFHYEYIYDSNGELKITNSGFISDLDLLLSANLETIIKRIITDEED